MSNLSITPPEVPVAASGVQAMLAAPAKQAPRATPSAPAAAPLTNPSMSLDPAIGIVVVQYYDSADNTTFSIPSQALLKAYSLGAEQPPGMTHATA